MSLGPSLVDSLFRLGKFKDIVASFDKRPDSPCSGEQLLMIAEAMIRTGHVSRGRQIASDLGKRPLPSALAARCEFVLGLAARESGVADEGLARFQVASRLARDAGDIQCAATSLLMALRMVCEGQPIRGVGAMLSDARTLTTRAGDPHLTALLHESVAKHEAQVGNLDEARRHLRIAVGLLDAYPNAWLEQLCALNAFCIEFLNSDLKSAEKHLKLANRLADLTGALEPVVANNVSHLQIQLGKFADAEATLNRLATKGVGQIRYGTLEGLAQLYLAAGQLEDCERTLQALADVEQSPGFTPSWLFRSSLITRLRLLIRQSKWTESVDAADVAIREAASIKDRHFLGIALFLKALAHFKEGSRRLTAEAILAAVDVDAMSNREYQGLFAEMFAHVVHERSAYLSSCFSSRAHRVWQERGVPAPAPLHAPLAIIEQPKTIDDDSQVNVFGAVNSLASALDLAYNPKLAGEELKLLIEKLRCSPRVRLTAKSTEVTSADSGTGCSLVLGTHRGHKLELSCESPEDPFQAILLGDILRIGRAALELERAREAERSRAALWPADPVEDQGDAIFLAEEMQGLLATVRRIAPTTVPVLITGETGTGKEVLARTIHACSNRAASTFLPFNCASTPRDMLDSQLFGHRRGAFTGAVEHFQGVIRAAAGGTLFLDEIGDAGLDVQPKLLRFLEAGEVHPIGETQPARVDVRVIAATNADLDGMVRDGRFREDLFYRLGIVRLHLPPLRERRVEIPSLANHYLRKHAIEYRKGDLRLSEDAMEYLMLYKWPGNVRQLANEMRRLAALAETSAVLMPEHLSPEITASRRTVPASERTLESTELVVRLDQPMAAAVRHLEQAMLQYALKKCEGRIEDTATMLGLSRKGLYLKRQRFGIEPPESAAVGA